MPNTVNAANVENAEALVSGAIFWAPSGTTLPTDASTALANTYTQIGYTSKDGFKIAIDRTTQQWDAWEADDIVEVDESHNVTTTFKPLETFGEQVAKMLFGASNVTVASSAVTKIKVNGSALPESVLVVEMRLRSGRKCRAVIPRWKITSEGEIAFNKTDPVASEIKAKCLPDANGDKAIFHFAASV